MSNGNIHENDVMERLRCDVEQRIGRTLASPADFVFLSDLMRREGLGYISPTTLKRVWGYISDKGEGYTPSNFTLRALSRLLGFGDWQEYCVGGCSLQSQEYTGEYVETRFMPLDTEISLVWQPNRRVRLRHIRPSLFEVIENENSRLRVGDTVECSCFTQHAPAFFRVFRANVAPLSYVAGSARGIFYVIHSGTDGTV
ncbi:MAG: hypothetical protein K2K68_08960 [Duncaniella sp.]|nr:hypothetical protein [Duncaniella sp.]